MRWIESLGRWFERRLQLSGAIRDVAQHRVPRSSASWWYVFGSAALTVFILQVVTGILLAVVVFGHNQVLLFSIIRVRRNDPSRGAQQEPIPGSQPLCQTIFVSHGSTVTQPDASPAHCD